MKNFKILVWLVIVAISVTGCSVPQLYFKGSDGPQKLGIYLENSGKLSQEEFELFEKSTEDFIKSYNSRYKDLELYISEIDSNSVHLLFLSNNYVNDAAKILSVLVNIAGVAVPIFLLVSKIPFFITFWSIPRNKTLINVDITKDVNPFYSSQTYLLKSNHKFLPSYKQPENHQLAYREFLGLLFNVIEIESKENLEYEMEILPDLVKLEDGREFRTKVSTMDLESTYITLKKDSKFINTYFPNDVISEIILEYQSPLTNPFPDLIIRADGTRLNVKIISEDDDYVHFKIKKNNKILETRLEKSSIKELIKNDISKLNVPTISFQNIIILKDGREITCEILNTDKEKTYFKIIKKNQLIETFFLNEDISEIKNRE